MIKRQRGRGRNPGQKPQNNNPNRAYESNGPDLKVRGSAQTVFEKYQQLARDAQSNGDRVLGENYMQHAEHYFRVLRAMQPNFIPRSELMIAGYDDEGDEGEEAQGGLNEGSEADGEAGQPQQSQGEFQQNRHNRDRDNRDRDNRDNRNRDNRDPRDNRDNRDRDFRGQANRDGQQNREPRDPNDSRQDNDEERYGRRRRRRPDRFGGDNYSQNGPRPEAANGEAAALSNGTDSYGSEDAPDRNRAYEGAPIARPADRPDMREGAPDQFEAPAQSDRNGFSDPQEMTDGRDNTAIAPVRERRPRTPRAARMPRQTEASEAGFGDDMPAFLTTAVPVSGD